MTELDHEIELSTRYNGWEQIQDRHALSLLARYNSEEQGEDYKKSPEDTEKLQVEDLKDVEDSSEIEACPENINELQGEDLEGDEDSGEVETHHEQVYMYVAPPPDQYQRLITSQK